MRPGHNKHVTDHLLVLLFLRKWEKLGNKQEITSLTKKQRQWMDKSQVVSCFCTRLSNLEENKHLRKHLKVVKALHFQQGVGFPYVHFPEHCERAPGNFFKDQNNNYFFSPTSSDTAKTVFSKDLFAMEIPHSPPMSADILAKKTPRTFMNTEHGGWEICWGISALKKSGVYISPFNWYMIHEKCFVLIFLSAPKVLVASFGHDSS